jgi:HPt (histidine-containing phosphotransfer) domain-containing protein
MADAPASPLDAAVLESLRQLSEPGQLDVVKEVLGLFLIDAPARMRAIDDAATARDAAALQRSAHTLKGASGTIGAFSLQRACRALEDMGKQASFDHVAAGLDTLHEEYRRVKCAIDQLL